MLSLKSGGCAPKRGDAGSRRPQGATRHGFEENPPFRALGFLNHLFFSTFRIPLSFRIYSQLFPGPGPFFRLKKGPILILRRQFSFIADKFLSIKSGAQGAYQVGLVRHQHYLPQAFFQ
jgi:hypothetical protein